LYLLLFVSTPVAQILTLLDAQSGQSIHPSPYRQNSVPVLHPTFTRYYHQGRGTLLYAAAAAAVIFFNFSLV
jgi:hypothetical protein